MMQKFTPKTFLPFLTILFFQLQIHAQIGCPGCQVNLPSGLASDTIYLDDLPDGEVNMPYDVDLSFRMPMTTTPVAANDPSILPNIPLDEIKITGIGNLPAGLSYEPNQGVYDLPNETDGCAKICGIPLIPGTYELEIFLEVKISFLTQNTSFQKILVVNGGSSNNNGFSTNQNIGCGELVVDFENNISSFGNSGYSYQWDFGNGTTSLDENPASQTYTPGSYEVNYQAIIDTFGFFLTNVTVTESDCNDILSALDLYLVLEDPDGNVISTANVGNTNPPVMFPLNYEIGAGNYTLTVMDEDGGIDGGDDVCGVFTINQLTGTMMSSGGADIELTIIHPVDTIQTTDSIFVYPVPDAPTISVVPSDQNNCVGDTITLMASQTSNIQWYMDGNEIPGETNQILVATVTGIYTVSYTNEFGCSNVSISEDVMFYENPPVPEFVDDNTNLLSLDAGITILPNYDFQWYFENTLLAGETEPTLCIDDSGVYTLEIIDNESGCSSVYFADGIFNSEYFCGEVDVEELIGNSLNIFPNPFEEEIFIELELNQIADLNIYVNDLLGRKTKVFHSNSVSGNFRQSLDLSNFSSGIYFLELEINDETLMKKIMKR